MQEMQPACLSGRPTHRGGHFDSRSSQHASQSISGAWSMSFVASFARRLASVVRSILMNVFMLKEMVRCHHRLAALHPQSALACILNMYAHHDPARRHGSDLTFCATQMNVV